MLPIRLFHFSIDDDPRIALVPKNSAAVDDPGSYRASGRGQGANSAILLESEPIRCANHRLRGPMESRPKRTSRRDRER